MSKSLRLIASLTSPFVRKVRVVMAEKRIDYQLELDDVYSSAARIMEYNPLGKVPCLILEDGGAVFDSRVIVEYLDTLTPVARLIPPSGRERLEVRTWEALADGMSDAALTVRMEKVQRSEAQQVPALLDRQMNKVHAALAAMSLGLAEKPWCFGSSFSLADIAVGVSLGYLDLRFEQLDWRTRYPNLARLQEKLARRPSFVDTAAA